MKKSLKVLLILIIVIFVISIIVLFNMKQQERNMRLALEKKFSQLEEEKMQVDQQLDETTEAKNKLQTGLDELKTQFTELEQQAAQEKTLKEEALAKMDQQMAVIQTLQKNFEAEKTQRADLENQFATIKKDYEELKSRYGRTSETKTSQAQINKTQQLDKIVFRPTGGLEGKIVSIGKNQEFVIIDLGEDDGITKGMMFNVYRNKTEIGKIQVDSVRKNVSAAKILKDWLYGAPAVGDSIELI